MSKIDDILSKCDSFDEKQHARDKDGKFGMGGQSYNSAVRAKHMAERLSRAKKQGASPEKIKKMTIHLQRAQKRP